MEKNLQVPPVFNLKAHLNYAALALVHVITYF